MKQRNTFNLYLARTAVMLSGARRVAMLLLLTLLTTATAWADNLTLTEDTEETEGTAARWYVNMPSGRNSNTLTLTDATITSFKVYDDGGKEGYYSNCDSYLTLTAPEGYLLVLSGTVMLGWNWDYLTVYDGTTTEKRIGKEKYGNDSDSGEDIGSLCSSGNSITLYFNSSWSSYGLDLTVRLIRIDNAISASTITMTQDIYGYTGSPIVPSYTVKDVNGNTLVKGTHYTETFSSETVQDKGAYTLTITGISPYVGSKSVSFAVVDNPLSGAGTSENPYLISSAGDWTTFATLVNDGTAYYDKFIKLNADNITVSEMVGASGHPFRGTFLGYGKTIELNINDWQDGTALFRDISGATIKDLTVAGSISGGDYCAALVGSADNATTNLIENVTVTATIQGNDCGGILGNAWKSITTLRDCVFAGTIYNGSTKLFWCRAVSGYNPTLINCVEKKTATDTYYLYNDPATTGSTSTHVTQIFPYDPQNPAPDGLVKTITAADGLQYYIPVNVSYVTGSADAAAISYTLKAGEDIILTEGTDYTVSVKNSADEPVSLTDATLPSDNYTFTFTGKEGSSCSGSQSIVIRLIEGKGTESNPYKIGSAADWDQFTYIVNGENGMTKNMAAWAVMTDDVPNAQERANGITGVSTNVNEYCSYSGTFNGAGHKLTVSYGTADNRVETVAPFIALSGGTIKFLHVDGHIFINSIAGGIICFGIDSNLISCRSSVSINTNNNGNSVIGGIAYQVRTNSNSVSNNISNCLFDGELTGTAKASCFVYDNRNSLNIENCLAAPQNIAIGDKALSTYVSTHGSSATDNITNSYYKLSGTYQAGNLQGTEVTTNAETLAELLGSSWMVDESGNVVPITDPHNLLSVHVSLPKALFWTGEAIALSYTVTDFDQNTLTKGTHFTASITKGGQTVSEVKDEGDYVLTLTAIDGSGYTGTKAISFNVGDGLAKDSEGNYYVEMVNKDTKEIRPKGRTTGFVFSIRNAGYPNRYPGTCDDKLIIDAPGYKMEINGTHYSGHGSTTPCINQYFEIYDGSWETGLTPAYTSSKSFYDQYAVSYNTQNDKALIRFYKDNSDNSSGTYLLNVKLTIITYNITYNLNGGTAGEGSYFTTYTVEQELTLPEPSREGYVFDGWYDNENFTGEPIATIKKGTTGNKTLYAHWIKNINDDDITVEDISNVVYTGKAVTPVTIKHGETTLTLNTDFTVTSSGDDCINVGDYTATIKGIGNYFGEFTKTFTVVAKSLSADDITIAAIADQTYTGSAFTPAVTVKHGETDIADQCDFTYSDNTNAGTATVTVTAKTAGNYSGEIKTTFNIVAKTVSTLTITLSATEYVYDGQAKEPAVSSVKVGDTVIPASEYTVAYENNTNAGTATVKIVDKDGGNYTVSGSTTFEIVLMGDANRDKKVNVADIVKLVNDNAPQSDIDEVVKIIMQNK